MRRLRACGHDNRTARRAPPVRGEDRVHLTIAKRRTHYLLCPFAIYAGADPGARASLRKRLRFTDDDAMHEFRDVTPLQWGERFQDRDWVNPAALDAIRELTSEG